MILMEEQNKENFQIDNNDLSSPEINTSSRATETENEEPKKNGCKFPLPILFYY